MAESSPEKSYPEDQYIPKNIKAHAQPSLNGNSHVIGSVFQIQSSFCIFDGSFLARVD